MHCAYCLTQCTKLKNLEKNTFRILTWKNNRLISIIKLETKVSWYFVTKIVLTYCENFFLNSRLSCSWRFHGFSNKSEQLYWDLETWRKIFRFALSFHISKLDLRFQKKNQMDFQVLGMILLLRIMLASICIQNNKITISKETRPKSILHQLPLTKGGPVKKTIIRFIFLINQFSKWAFSRQQIKKKLYNKGPKITQWCDTDSAFQVTTSI